MTPQSPSVGSTTPSIALDTTLARSPKVPESSTEQRTWNTKNLGLRLASDAVAGIAAASMNASGQATLKNSLKLSMSSFLLRPHSLLFTKPVALICMVYGGTYFTANTLDTITSTVQNKPSSYVTSGTAKFAASSTANIGLCVFKDQVFAKLFGPGGPPRPVPLPSYALFTLRDCLTIFASFNVPPLLGPVISRNMSAELQKSLICGSCFNTDSLYPDASFGPGSL
ncbi:hypothetical protein D0Z07_0292 [Hyphodiscus hymeniophilus]|uniref:Sequence orphan n=1 Tax=Hyphodiscus hymeniophilus TaxID=353542 RepID=A0A9P6VQW4_9HELO|nr:hypothetical protein D0Z07_0292 [Hyphodiscus hymeniophilus]